MPKPVDVHVGSAIKRLRTARGFSLEQLGSQIGVSFQQIQKYESALNRVSASQLAAIAGALGVPVGEFFPEELARTELTEEEQELLSRFRSTTTEGRQLISKVITQLG